MESLKAFFAGTPVFSLRILSNLHCGTPILSRKVVLELLFAVRDLFRVSNKCYGESG